MSADTKPRPELQLHIRGERYVYRPQRDITAYELAQIMILFGGLAAQAAALDLESWWDDAGPGVWRHFGP